MFFKYRACHLTIYEEKTAKHTIYNQIDYINLRQNRKRSMMNELNENINHRIESHHRPVKISIRKKLDFERKNNDHPEVLHEIPPNQSSPQQRSFCEKKIQYPHFDHILAWKKGKALLQRKIKVRQQN